MMLKYLIVCLGLCCGSAAWGQAILLPNAQQQFVDANGAPYAGGKVYFYVPGTTTPQATFVDQGLTTPNANPVVLDSAGRAQIWGQGLYREVLYDQFGNIVWDQITGAQFGTFTSFACTGSCTAPTQPFATSNTQIATTQFVQDALASPQIHLVTTGGTLPSSACGQYSLLSGGFYTATLGPASSYVSTNRPNCIINLLNVDGNAGKTISVSGLTAGDFGTTGCGLSNICPGQSLAYLSDGSSWHLFRNPEAWRPTSAQTLYADPGGANSNDCLASTRPCLLGYLCTARSGINPSAGDGTNINITIKMADGNYPGNAGQAVCGIEGNSGFNSSALTFIDGDDVTATNVQWLIGTGGIGLFTKDLGETEISNFTLVNAGAGAATSISGAQFSVVDLLQGIYIACPGTGGIGIHFTQSASVNLDADIRFFNGSGGCTTNTLIDIGSNANFLSDNNAKVFYFLDTGSDAFTGAVVQNEGGYINLANVTFNVAGTVSGVKAANYAIGTVGTASGGCWRTNGTKINSIVPGNVSQAFPIGTCADFDLTDVFANLPVPVNGFRGTQFQISDSTTNTWGANVTIGSGADGVTVVNNGSNYTVMGK